MSNPTPTLFAERQLLKLAFPEAEEAVLGSCLIDPTCAGRLGLTPDAFFLVRNRWIWEAMQRLRDRNEAIDFLTVRAELEAARHLAEVGGPAYLTGLMNAVPTAIHAEAYANILRERAERRELYAIAQALVEQVFDTEHTLDEVRTQAVTRVVESMRITGGGAQPVAHFVAQLYDQVLDAYENPRDLFGLPTGFADLDKITAGMQQQEVFLIAGDPGIGKSTLAVQIGCQMAGLRLGPTAHPAPAAPGVIYEMEMGGVQTARRIIAVAARLRVRALRSGRITEDDWDRFVAASGQVSDLPIYLSDASHWTTASLRADLSRLVTTAKVQWCVIDYLNLLKDKYGKDDAERIAHISARVHDIARDLNLAIISVQRLNKAGMRAGIAQLEDLSGSSQVPYDADQVTILTEHVPDSGVQKVDDWRTLTFRKIREDDPNRKMHLARLPGLPGFADAALDPLGAPRTSGNGRPALPEHYQD